MQQCSDWQSRIVQLLIDRAIAAWRRPSREDAGPFPARSTSTGCVGEPTAVQALEWQRVESPSDPAFEDLVAFAHRQYAYWRDMRTAPTHRDDVAQMLRVLPPGANAGDKVLWALRCQGRVVGCLDVTRHWPRQGTVSIGLLLVDETLRRRGFGASIMTGLAVRCRTWPGVRRLRAAVVEHQGAALAFWRHGGFVDTGERRAAPGLRSPLRVLERAVPHRTATGECVRAGRDSTPLPRATCDG